jgi:hypothetical protein
LFFLHVTVAVARHGWCDGENGAGTLLIEGGTAKHEGVVHVRREEERR